MHLASQLQCTDSTEYEHAVHQTFNKVLTHCNRYALCLHFRVMGCFQGFTPSCKARGNIIKHVATFVGTTVAAHVVSLSLGKGETHSGYRTNSEVQGIYIYIRNKNI